MRQGPLDGTVGALLERARHDGLAALDAQVLLAHLLGHDRTWLRAHAEATVPAPLRDRYAALCARRLDAVPVAYLTGQREFHGLRLAITPEVLDPRPDTEVLVDWALQCLRGPLAHVQHPRVADLGTGSGAIALAIKHRCPCARVTGTDISSAALRVAASNARRLGLELQWHTGDWLEAWPGPPLDLLVSNPPYVAEDDAHLQALRHEPRSALVAGHDGLGAIRRIAAGAPAHLAPGAWLLLEHGFDQAAAVAQLLDAAGFVSVGHRHDLAGHRRATGGCWPPRP